jgi:hypothetical protein
MFISNQFNAKLFFLLKRYKLSLKNNKKLISKNPFKILNALLKTIMFDKNPYLINGKLLYYKFLEFKYKLKKTKTKIRKKIIFKFTNKLKKKLKISTFKKKLNKMKHLKKKNKSLPIFDQKMLLFKYFVLQYKFKKIISKKKYQKKILLLAKKNLKLLYIKKLRFNNINDTLRFNKIKNYSQLLQYVIKLFTSIKKKSKNLKFKYDTSKLNNAIFLNSYKLHKLTYVNYKFQIKLNKYFFKKKKKLNPLSFIKINIYDEKNCQKVLQFDNKYTIFYLLCELE